jgi:SAM-dependent methyltransferase
LLDIGCGALDKTTVLQKMGYESFGCDDFQDPWHRQQKNLDPILEYANKCGVQVQVQGDDYVIPWDEGSFDVILMVNVIEHLHESPRKFLNSAGSYLREGGLFVVVMPNSVNLRKRLAVAMGRSNYTPARGFFENDGVWRGHVREYTLRETSQILEWAGFDVLKRQTFHGMVKQRLGNPVLRLLFQAVCLPVPGFRDTLLVAARKPVGWTPRQPDIETMDQSLTDSWVT